MGILSLLGGGILGQVGDLVKVFLGSKSERDAAIAEEMKAVQEAYTAELNAAEKIGWWASFIDNLNRLVRPFFTFGSVGILVWAVVDPVRFQVSMVAAGTIPEPLWYLIYTVVGFWFGGRLLERAPTRITALSATEIAAVLNAQKKLAKVDDPVPAPTEIAEPSPIEKPVAPKPKTQPKAWENRHER